jgi:hypothetical protein
VRLVGLYT